MKNNFWIGQKVWDTTYRVNSGLPVQIIQIENTLVKVWFPQAEDGVEITDVILVNDIKPC
jgi:hypothetical protein